MASITAASNPRPLNETCLTFKFKAAATTITAGEAVYVSAADTVAIADPSTYAAAMVIGIARETPTYAGQWIDVCCYGPVTGYSSLTAGNDIWLHDDGALTETFDGSDNTANGDLAETEFACRVGIAVNATTIFVNPQQPGFALAA